MRAALRLAISGRRGVSFPSLPFAAGARVMAFGHSFIADGHFSGSTDGVNVTSITSRMLSDLGWLRALDQRFNVDSWADPLAPASASGGLSTSINGSFQGIGGDQLIFSVATKPGFIPREPYVAARRPDIICLSAPTNDVLFGGYATAAPIIALYDQILSMLYTAGIWVVAETIAPFGTAEIPNGDVRLTVTIDFNTWLKAQATANRPGLKVLDIEAIFGTGRPSQTYWLQTDGLHPQERGSYAVSLVKLALLQTMVSAGSYYSLTYNGPDNLMPLATLAGTGGSKTSVTGSLATGCNVNLSAGTSTVAASKEAVAGLYEKQVFTITPVVDATLVHGFQFQQNSNVTLASLGLAVGDWIQMLMHIELSAWDGWVRASPSIFLSAGNSNKFTHSIFTANSTSGTYLLPTGGLDYWAISEPVQIPSGMSIDTLRVAGGNSLLICNWRNDATGTGVAKVSTPILRKVSDPRPAWHLP